MHRRRFGHVTPRALVGVVGAVVGLGALSWASARPETVAPSAAAQPTGQPADETTAIDMGALVGMMRGNGNGGGNSNSDLPAWKDVSEGFTQVISTTDEGSFYGVWINKKENRLLAEMPRGYERQKHFFAMTVSGGEIFAGLQAGDLYCYWKRIGNSLALISPQIAVRSTGDQASRDSVDMIFTDRLVLSVPIVANGPSGQPVIDLNGLLLGNATTFFGASAAGVRANLAEIAEAKAFPENIEIAYRVPVANGTFKTLHYSISRMEGSPGYKPRLADERVGFFTTSYRDLGKFDREQVNVRYINRWNLEKADPKLKMSPPKKPIIFYVEHTVPVRYRRWVRAGIEYWNKAFEQIGIVGAIEVRFQDKETGAHMEKDPEDVRYNFIRWLSNDVSTAIGPSRVNPMTGEILDADVVLTDGWIRVFTYQWNDLMPKLATEGMSPQTLAWLDQHPTWDPRVRLADPLRREAMLAGDREQTPLPLMSVDPTLIGDDEYDGLIGRTSQINGNCRAADGKALSLAIMRMHLELGLPVVSESAGAAEQDGDDIPAEMLEKLKENPELMALLPAEVRTKVEAMLAGKSTPAGMKAADDDGDKAEKKEEKKNEPKEEPKEDLIDGVPETFVGQSIGELVAHEVGHTLGLRHNFKASSCYSMDEINSEEMKGHKPFATSVMDYNPVNIRMPGTGTVQGDYAVIDIGPYDMWAIEYGYGFGDTSKILSRCSEPELQYGTDEDTWGPDPLARRYDLSSNPLDYARNQMELVKYHRANLIDRFVKDGQSWSRARRGYEITLSQQVQALSMMGRWVGGAFVYRDKKGDPNGRAPIEVVPVDKQRAALNFIIENAFRDEAFGLTPEMLRHMTVDKWYDESGMNDLLTDPTYTVHDKVAGVQATALTLLMNPYTLQRVYDNEYFTPAGEDMLTLPELLDTIYDGVWGEIAEPPARKTTAREPMISSLRRNLQREHVQRLIDLSIPGTSSVGPAERSIATLATAQLRRILGEIEAVRKSAADKIDPYTSAHLDEMALRIDKALDAQFIYNTDAIGGGGLPINLFMQEKGR
ncbi:MAG: zinc-dependent metalloprotease [Phycisphaerales bacterium]